MTTHGAGVRRLTVVGPLVLVLLAAVPSAAQESRTVALARELGQVLEQRQIDAIATADPAAEDQFVAALFFPGSQLLAVSARYAMPELIEKKLAARSFRDVYVDLFSASILESRLFISDLGADGLRPRRSGSAPYDTVEIGSRRVAFDGDWRRQEMTEAAYMERFSETEESYVRMLTALIAAARALP